MAQRRNNRPSLVDIDTSSDDDDSYETPTPSPDEDYAPSSDATTPSSVNSHAGAVDDDDMDVIAQNHASMDVNQYGSAFQRTDDGETVRRSKRAPRPVQRAQYIVDDDDDEGEDDKHDSKPFGVEDAKIDGEWIGSEDSDDEEDDDEEAFYHKHPEMRGFVVSDDSAEESNEDYDDDDEDDSYSSDASSTPKATEAELTRVLKPQRCKKSDEETKCAICVSHFRCRQVYVALPACQHRFHQTCIRPWLANHNRCCPTCRKDITSSP